MSRGPAALTGMAGRCAAAVLLALLLARPAAGLSDEEQDQYGRLHARHPVRHCCVGAACAGRGGRHAFVTSLRSAEYMMGLRELACSLNQTNPGVPLVVLVVAGDLDAAALAQAASLGELRMVDDIRVPNSRGRYFLNWVKLRAWEWTEYDALLLLDADTLVRGDLTHLFALPAEFAWAGANGRGGYDWNRGGVLLLRPCAATFAAMMYVAHTHERLQFRDALAEQDFLAWFFRYTLLALPLRYNLNFRFLDAATGLGPGGTDALVLHFADADDKAQLFHAAPGSRAWPYLCYQPSLAAPALGAAPAGQAARKLRLI